MVLHNGNLPERSCLLPGMFRLAGLLSCLLLLGMLLFGSAARAQLPVPDAARALPQSQPLVLHDQQSTIDLWPSVRMLSDPSHAMSIQQVLADSDHFIVPQVPYANLGPRPDTVWLRAQLQVPADARAALTGQKDYNACLSSPAGDLQSRAPGAGQLRLTPLYQAQPNGGNETAGGLCKQ